MEGGAEAEVRVKSGRRNRQRRVKRFGEVEGDKEKGWRCTDSGVLTLPGVKKKSI